MAFLSKFGNILRQGANKRIGLDLHRSSLSLSQAVRWMSSMESSKVFVGGSLRILCYCSYIFFFEERVYVNLFVLVLILVLVSTFARYFVQH